MSKAKYDEIQDQINDAYEHIAAIEAEYNEEMRKTAGESLASVMQTYSQVTGHRVYQAGNNVKNILRNRIAEAITHKSERIVPLKRLVRTLQNQQMNEPYV